MDPKIFNIKHIKKCTQKYKKMQKTHRNCKNHTKNAKNDISGITDILPGFSPYWLSPITSFHQIGYPRYYRDILESVPTLKSCSRIHRCPGGLPTALREHWVIFLDRLRPEMFPGIRVIPEPATESHAVASSWMSRRGRVTRVGCHGG